MTMKRLLAAALLLPLSGCYYAQAIQGHWSLMAKREPVAKVLADPQTSAAIAGQLRFSEQVLDFAGQALSLPTEDVYQQYVPLEGEAVVWNVLAAPAFSLTPKTWCYPVVGCVSYRGYFREAAARAQADKLAAKGFDTWVGGAIAYSTLGWFDDPLTTPMLHYPQPALAELLIHELAHRRLYIKNDTRFNESLATLVGREGAVDFLAASGQPLPEGYWARRERLRQAFLAIVEAAREELAELYGSAQEPGAVAVQKAAIQQRARQRFAEQQQQLPELAGYQDFFAGPLNNAQLNGVSDYNGLVPAFAAILASCERRWPCFWQQVEALAELPAAEREQALKASVKEQAWN